jgi:glycerol dehydrogenase
MLSVFSCPSRYTQGKNATAQLGQEMRTIGLEGPALILAGRSAIERLSEVWRKTLGDVGVSFDVHRFGGECSLAEIERIKGSARKLSARVIIAAGGGKALDAGRAVAADLGLPVVNCPTIASSDAPCSALSVIYTEEGEVQEYRIYGRNPELVLVDTEVIAHSPVRLLVAGMGDALATVFEARTCVAGHVKNMRGGASTRSALALAELCYRTLLEDGAEGRRSVVAKVVTPALERLVEANTLLSGLGFESSGLAAAHAVHNGLTAVRPTHSFFHGEKVAFGTLVQLVLEGKPRGQIREVVDFSLEVGLPVTLAAIGLDAVSREMLERIAARATAPGETMHNEPFAVTADLVADAIVAADALGRTWQRATVS